MLGSGDGWSRVNWYGVKTVFSKCVKGFQPTVNGRAVPLEVWLSPSMARWDYVPIDRNGPYRMIRADVNGGPEAPIYGYIESPQFMGLVTEFATEHMPRRDEVCAILDRHCTIVIGWIWNGEKMEWQGCQYGFEVLSFHHPINAVIWERQARESQDKDLINLEEWA
jgi:hypothetical protein